jgi:hypothetical protein
MKSFPRKYLAISYHVSSSSFLPTIGAAYLVPEGDISSSVIDDGPEFAVLLEVRHESLQSVDTVDEIDDSLFLVLVVQCLPDIVDSLAQDGGQSNTHGSLEVSGQAERKIRIQLT